MPPAAVLFDLDGTLVDTAPDLVSAANFVLGQDGKPAAELQALRPLVSHGGLAMLAKAYGWSTTDPRLTTKLDLFLEFYRDNLLVSSRLFPGMEEVLRALEAADIPWGIVTNKRTRLTRPLVELLGISGRSACVVCGDTVEHPKPHPAPLWHASRQIGVDPAHCVFVGDAAKDIEAGARAGMRTVAVSFGYRDLHDDPARWGADHVVHHALELMELF